MMRAVPLEISPNAMPDMRAVMERAGGENFPVAARVLSRRHRRHLLAVYGFARLTDELGDEIAGDRLAALDWLEGELDRVYAGNARHPLLVRLQGTLAECALPRAAFVRLIDANRLDQHVSSYRTWEQLRAYCELSANPVGELVLGVFGLASAERIALSDNVCTALQLAEHLQDVAEDARRGRVYLPEEDLLRFGCSQQQLASLVSRGGVDLDLKHVQAGSSTPDENLQRSADRLRETISFETARARELLAAGAPLLAGIGGRPKLAVGAFVAGGHVALDGIERAGFEVIGTHPPTNQPTNPPGVPRASRLRRLRALASVLAGSRA
ncbi:MAG: squalene synthase HpnC [Solirubrobacteraceae bacterium]